jgi:type I restriction enzyme S subunit
MTPQELKNSILQLAIQGKLVEQRPEEGTAEELFAQIQTEKQRLIKEGKIKKEKPMPEIAEEETPFDIPEGWKWVRLGVILTMNPKNDLEENLDTAFIPMPCVSDGYRDAHTFEVRKWREINKGFTHFADGDIGIAKITPCFQNRKSVIFKNLINGHGAGTTELSVVRIIGQTMLRKYLLWFFKSDYFISNGMKSFTGTAGQQRISKDYLSNCLFPLPPLAEQKRIVAKIEELLPYIDRYEQAWSKLEDFSKRFPTDMQKSILKMAIQGKLVEQRPEEGSAEELYRQIQAEKQQLVKDGKLKKQKPLPEITEDEKPFDIPESWKWVRLAEICKSIADGDHQAPPQVPNGIPFLVISNLSSGKINFSNTRYVPPEYFNKLSPERIAKNGDLLFTVTGSYGIPVQIIDCPPFCFQRHMALLKGQIDGNYLYNLLKSPLVKGQCDKIATGTAQKTVGLLTLKNLLIPLPPLTEQKRIVAKLEEILPLCERLK